MKLRQWNRDRLAATLCFIALVILFQNCGGEFKVSEQQTFLSQSQSGQSTTPEGGPGSQDTSGQPGTTPTPSPIVNSTPTPTPTPIVNPADPNADLSVSLSDAEVKVGGELSFKLDLSKSPTVAVSISLETIAGTALAKVDFEELKTNVVIPAGTTSSVVKVKTMAPGTPTAVIKKMKLRASSISVGKLNRAEAEGSILGTLKYSTFKQLSVGFYSACGVTESATVKCWGLNEFGLLAQPYEVKLSNTPLTIANLSGIVKVSIGGYHSCALDNQGKVYCWGYNAFGQLGRSPNQQAQQITAIPNLTGIRDISSGFNHSVGVTNSNELKAWGIDYTFKTISNSNGTVIPIGSDLIVNDPHMTDVKQFSTRNFWNCALSNQNKVQCWYPGVNSGFLPFDLSGLNDVKEVQSGIEHACALTNGGKVYCWGDNAKGQLGNGTTNSSNTPVEVAGLTGAQSLLTGENFTCTVTSQNTVKCWGDNTYKQLGNAAVANMSTTPVDLPGLTNIKSVSGSYRYICALGLNGAVKCWGNYSYSAGGPSGIPVDIVEPDP